MNRRGRWNHLTAPRSMAHQRQTVTRPPAAPPQLQATYAARRRWSVRHRRTAASGAVPCSSSRSRLNGAT